MPESDPSDHNRTWRSCVSLLLAGAFALGFCSLLLALALHARLASIPTYPEHKKAAFQRLGSVGPDRVVAEGRALMSQVHEERGFEPTSLPAGLAALGGIPHVTSESVTLRYPTFGGDLGTWEILRDRGDSSHRGFVQDGLLWLDPFDAPEGMRGVPGGWRRR